MLSQFIDQFCVGNVSMLTFKGPLAKHQKIGFVNDRVRKISSTYVIVREQNKKSEGYHFHALIKHESEPKPSWFIKGVHMHFRRLGGDRIPVELPLGGNVDNVVKSGGLVASVDLLEAKYHEDPGYQELRDDVVHRMTDRLIDNACTRYTQKGYAESCLHYMSKELEMPIQYADYIICLSNKMTTIQ